MAAAGPLQLNSNADNIVFVDLAFEPDAARALRLDQSIRLRLADSLAAIAGACAGHLAWQPQMLARLLASLRSAPVRPAIFALHAGLAEAVFANDLAAAQTWLDRLISLPEPTALSRQSGADIFTLADHHLGPGMARLYEAEILTADPDAAHLPFDSAAYDRALAACGGARRLLAAAAPALAAEMNALTREIILAHRLVAGQPDGALTGASAFFLWGAAFIKFTGQPDRLALAEAMVHEAAHMLLFGFTEGAPLVTNPAQSRYPSPLREDERPMDGLVHAAYVLCRLCYYYIQMLKSGMLTGDETISAGAALAQYRSQFRQADAIISREAIFTQTGAAAYQAARHWMLAMDAADGRTSRRQDHA